MATQLAALSIEDRGRNSGKGGWGSQKKLSPRNDNRRMRSESWKKEYSEDLLDAGRRN
jgi:hypothetical protein